MSTTSEISRALNINYVAFKISEQDEFFKELKIVFLLLQYQLGRLQNVNKNAPSDNIKNSRGFPSKGGLGNE